MHWRSASPHDGSIVVFSRGPDQKKRGEPLLAKVVLDEQKDGAWPSDQLVMHAEISI